MSNQPATSQPASRQPTEVLRSSGDEPGATVRRQRTPSRFPWMLGAIGLVLVVASAVVQAIGIAQASALNWELGTQLALLAIGLSAAAFLVGLAAVILNRGRGLGVLAMLLGVLANPIVLVQLFRVLG